jgi:aldose 1-epimerase
MYEIKSIEVPSEGFEIILDNQRVVQILTVGATLNALSFDGHDLLDGYDRDEIQSFAWSKSALLFPFPNRLRDGQYEFEGQTYQFPINESRNHNALHGFLYHEPFELVSQEVEEEYAALAFQFDFQGTYDYFPFPFLFQVRYAISKNLFEATFEVQNTGNQNLPYGFGWHPYFMFSEKVDDLILEFPVGEEIKLDDRQLPTGELKPFDEFAVPKLIGGGRFDTGFKLGLEDYAVAIKNVKGESVELKAKNLPYLQLFTPDDRKRLAMEPMSCGIDVLNTGEGLSLLAPGQSERFLTEINYKKK